MATDITHIGIIMDGNRRWAKARGLSAHKGHAEGYVRAKDVVRWCEEAGISVVTLYAFSTENLKRAKKEVSFLMALFERLLTKEIGEFAKEGTRLRIIGSKEGFSVRMKRVIASAEKSTEHNTRIMVNIAFNYGGRDEIVRAMKNIAQHPPRSITEETVAARLDTRGMPDLDLIIRTGGEMRLSGFLLWQSAYAELYFTKTHWPAFSEKEFATILADFKKRHRRFGK
ncbi:MAG: polyprenyl diphosphate synthase [Patescibacteria group bacterium]